jgi:hypothetical protein
MTAQIISLSAMDAVIARVDAYVDDALALADLGDFDAAIDKVDAIMAVEIDCLAPGVFMRRRIREACDDLLRQLGHKAGLGPLMDGGKEPA